MRFAPLIVSARKRLGLSQRDLALEVGVSARAVWIIENGGGTIKVLLPILAFLRIALTGLPPAQDLGARIGRLAGSADGPAKNSLIAVVSRSPP